MRKKRVSEKERELPEGGAREGDCGKKKARGQRRERLHQKKKEGTTRGKGISEKASKKHGGKRGRKKK